MMPDILLVLLEVVFISYIMKFIAKYCIDKALKTKNHNVKIVWFLLSITIMIIALSYTIYLIWTLIKIRFLLI